MSKFSIGDKVVFINDRSGDPYGITGPIDGLSRNTIPKKGAKGTIALFTSHSPAGLIIVWDGNKTPSSYWYSQERFELAEPPSVKVHYRLSMDLHHA